MKSRIAGELRLSMDEPLSLEEHIINVVTAFTRGQRVMKRSKVTKGTWTVLKTGYWNFAQYEYYIDNKPVTASPDPTDPPTIELEVKAA